jgi:hypothetical protein
MIKLPGSNPRFLCPKSKIFGANTYTSHVDMILCNFIKSKPDFETVFNKISLKKNYIFIFKKLIKNFQTFQTILRTFLQTNKTFI